MLKKITFTIGLFLALFKLSSAQNISHYKAEIINVYLQKYALPKTDNVLSVEVKNTGATTISSLNLNWSDGTKNTISNIKTTILPGKTTIIKHPVKINYSTIGEKNITVSLSKINNQEALRFSNTKTIKFNTLSKSGTKAILVEEGTGTWCGWCPAGAVAIDYMYEKYPEDFIAVAVHVRDPMTNKDYQTNSFFNAYPQFHVDRELRRKPIEKIESMEPFYKERINMPVPADLSAKGNVSGNEISITAKAKFYTNFNAAKFRLGVIVTENGVTGTANNYAQSNNFAGGSEGPMGGYEDKPNPVPAKDMVYNHVGRETLGGYNGQAGSIKSLINTGDFSEYTFTYSVPDGFVKENFHFIVVLIDEESKNIVNAKEILFKDVLSTKKITKTPLFKIYPNPTSENITINFKAVKDDYSITIYDLLGKSILSKKYTNLSGKQNITVPISELNKGTYLMSISNTKESYNKRIIIE